MLRISLSPTESFHEVSRCSVAACLEWISPKKLNFISFSILKLHHIFYRPWQILLWQHNSVIFDRTQVISWVLVHVLSMWKANNTCQMIQHRRKPSNWSLELHLTSYLRHCVELYHGSSERFCICAKWWDQPQHCTVECSIYLSKWSWSRIVHINHRNMS